MKKIPVVFLCGDRSPYGLAHLQGVREHFDLKALIVADGARWDIFRKALAGGEITPGSYGMDKWNKLLMMPVARVMAEFKRLRVLRRTQVPIHVVHDVNSSAACALIKKHRPDLLVSAAYPQIFRKKVLALAPRGAINFHPSLLPRCRGAHPHYWSLASGEDYGGVSAHFMTERIDDGAIVAQRTIALAGLYYAELYARIIEETQQLVREVARCLDDPLFQASPQDETLATYFRNDRIIHHKLDWLLMDSGKLHDLIRAGGAFALLRGRKVWIARARLSESNRHMTNGLSVSPGVIVDIQGGGVWIATKDERFLVVEAFSCAGRQVEVMPWSRKNRVLVGMRFE